MLRLLLLGILLSGLTVGLQRGWLDIHWDRIEADLNLPSRFGGAPDPR